MINMYQIDIMTWMICWLLYHILWLIQATPVAEAYFENHVELVYNIEHLILEAIYAAKFNHNPATSRHAWHAVSPNPGVPMRVLQGSAQRRGKK